MSSPSPAPGKSGQFNPMRIVIIVVPIAIVLGGVLVFVSNGGLEWISSGGGSKLVEVRGKVTFKGQPVADATIETQIDGSDDVGSMAETDEQGNYSLMTSVDGPYENGAFSGTHKVTVAVFIPNPGVGPPALASPEKFSQFGSTPLVIEVKSGGSSGTDIKLEDHMTADEIKDYQAKIDSGETGGPVAQMLGTYDTDDDGKLSMEEIESVEERFRDRAKAADTNADGFVDEAELEAMMTPNIPRPGGGDEEDGGGDRGGRGGGQGRGGQGRGGQGRGGDGGGGDNPDQ